MPALTRDELFAKNIAGAHGSVVRLHATAEQFEQHADREQAHLHAVLYGKIADELKLAIEALWKAWTLADPEQTEAEGEEVSIEQQLEWLGGGATP